MENVSLLTVRWQESWPAFAPFLATVPLSPDRRLQVCHSAIHTIHLHRRMSDQRRSDQQPAVGVAARPPGGQCQDLGPEIPRASKGRYRPFGVGSHSDP